MCALAFLLGSWSSALAADASGLAGVASWYDRHKPSLTREDCSGLVSDILNRAGFDVYGTVTTIWGWAREYGYVVADRTPRVGDLVFWDRTYDSNRNGRVDDRLTHIGVVIGVDDDGTATIVHRSSSDGITTNRMNLLEPDVHARDGVVLNSYLARPDYAGSTGDRLTGQLFASFARIGGAGEDARTLDVEESVAVLHAPAASVVAPSPAGSSLGAPEPLPTRRELRAATRADRRAHQASSGEVSAAMLLSSALTEAMGPRPPAYIVATVRLGAPLSARDLGRLSCEELWWVRNAAFARHGYSFHTPRARFVFGAEPWYRADPEVRLETAATVLTEVDRDNVRLALRYERGCDAQY